MAQTYSDKPTLEAWNAMAEASGSAPKVAYGSYVGNGKYGTANHNTLTFDFEPKLIVLENQFAVAYGGTINDNYYSTPLLLLRPLRRFYIYYDASDYIDLAWDGNTVSWWTTSGAFQQFNVQGQTYLYHAIG